MELVKYTASLFSDSSEAAKFTTECQALVEKKQLAEVLKRIVAHAGTFLTAPDGESQPIRLWRS